MSLFSFIKAQLSILDVVSEYVSLRQAGNYWKGPCPFHQEKDASFTISPDKGIFYCFGCHAGGDVIAFIAKQENFNQLQAAHHLIERFSLKVPEHLAVELKGGVSGDKKREYHHMCQMVATWAHEQLLTSKPALSYLESRGIEQGQISYFNIGYFPGGPKIMDRFIKTMNERSVLAKDLLETGIIIESRNGYYSPFEERILFPINDAMGNSCGFGGRIFKPGDERPKYYNSKESILFNKGHLLFGLDLAKKEMQHDQKAYLVEGYLDCVAMIKYGYKATVATLGTACTIDHLKLLSRHVKNVYVLYDGDKAGQKAILRVTGLCWGVNIDLKVVCLPSNEDPASYLTSGNDLKGRIDQAQDIFSFFVASIGADYQNKSLTDKMESAHKIVEVIAHLTDSFKRDVLLQQASQVMQLPFDSLKSLMMNLKVKGSSHIEQVDNSHEEVIADAAFAFNVPSVEEKMVIGLINGLIFKTHVTIDDEIINCFSEPMKEIVDAYKQVQSNCAPQEQFQALLDVVKPEYKQWIVSKSMEYEVPSVEALHEMIARFRKQYWKTMVQNLKKSILHAKQSQDTQKLESLLQEFVQLKDAMKNKGLV